MQRFKTLTATISSLYFSQVCVCTYLSSYDHG
jgi:hypothetical protein